MSLLRLLASQTAIYGLSSILGRFLNYLLVPLYTYTFSAEAYGVVSEFYAYAGFLAVVLVFGLETGYFRFRQQRGQDAKAVYGSSLAFLVVTSCLFFAAVLYWRQELASWLHHADHPEYLVWFAGILAMDTVSALPFARLRAENRAWRFAGVKFAEILITIGLNLFFLLLWPKLVRWWPDSPVAGFYRPQLGVGYIFLANLLASLVKLALLLPQFRQLTWPRPLLLPILRYSLPMVVIGLAGMVNEMLDRAVLKILLPYDVQTNLKLLGIYGACYKLSVLMTLFVQAFRYAGEPFFFAYADHSDARRIYARVMQYFVMAGVFIFLLVTLFLDFFQYFIGAEYRVGLDVVPILLLANLCLGIYVNLSVWYKLGDRTGLGAWVAIAGALVTILLNVLWIPRWGYLGSAWATLACYVFMVCLSWLLGRRFYPVPYPLLRMTAYLGLGLVLYVADRYLTIVQGYNVWFSGFAGLLVYLAVVGWSDIKPLRQRGRRS